jgi:CarD family transcriptional regulator
VQHITETEAVKEVEANLAKSPRRGAAKAEAGADAVAGESSDDDGDDDDSVSEDEAA